MNIGAKCWGCGTKKRLEFDTPIWASHENAESYGWQSFASLGESNAPEWRGSSSGPEIVSVPVQSSQETVISIMRLPRDCYFDSNKFYRSSNVILS